MLADPLRREVVELLAEGPVGAGEIAERFPVTRPAVSRHLRVLREAGLVRSVVRGQHRVYVLERAGLAALDGWLERFRPLPRTAAVPDRTVLDHTADGAVSRALPGPAGRLDALDTELRRGRRARTDQTPGDARDTG